MVEWVGQSVTLTLCVPECCRVVAKGEYIIGKLQNIS